jgi:histidinol dehydrogenase
MKVFKYPDPQEWTGILQRNSADTESLELVIAPILEAVRRQGDGALFAYTRTFDKVDLKSLVRPVPSVAESGQLLENDLRIAIDQAHANIQLFHRSQEIKGEAVETMPGVRCWWEKRPIERVGLYIPGGTAPLISTVLMLGVPAQLAGCAEVVLCTPPDQDGKVHSGILYAAALCGVQKLYTIGGAQAIAAMAFGTQTVPQVDKIFGPGNSYVTQAKQMVQREGIAIDLPAGPSEVLVVADATADPEFVAADLLSQAEHGADSQAVLVCLDPTIFEAVREAVDRQIQTLPRQAIARKAMEGSPAILIQDQEEAVGLINAYAPEHLLLQVANPEKWVPAIQNAGSVFLGSYSPESVGDYATGTNHTLPTNGFARSYSGLGLDAFQKTVTFQQLTENGLTSIGPTVSTLAAAEKLEGHRRAVEIRLNSLND